MNHLFNAMLIFRIFLERFVFGCAKTQMCNFYYREWTSCKNKRSDLKNEKEDLDLMLDIKKEIRTCARTTRKQVKKILTKKHFHRISLMLRLRYQSTTTRDYFQTEN